MTRRGWVLLAVLLLVPAAGYAKKSSYSKGHFLLSLDGEPAMVKRVSQPKKDAAKNSLEIEIEPAGTEAIWAWVKASFDQGSAPKKLIVPVGTQRSVELTDVLIHEISFPALDAASKDAGSVWIRVATTHAGTTSKKAVVGTASKQAKNWLTSNFTLTIPGGLSKSVKKVGALTWSMKVQEMRTGKAKSKSAPPPLLSTTLTFDAASAAAWQAWAKSKTGRTVQIALTDDAGTTLRTLVLDDATVSSVKVAGATGTAVLEVGKISLK